VRLLCLTADTFPVFRPDVEVLFFKELLAHGIESDWIMQSREAESDGEVEWEGGCYWLRYQGRAASRIKRVARHFSNFVHDLKLIPRLAKGDYDVLQVKDKFLIVLPALLAARLTRTKFCYWLSFPYPEASLHAAGEKSGRFPRFYLLRGHVFRIILYQLIARFADQVFVQSEYMLEDMAGKGMLRAKMTAVPMGVDLETIPAVHRRPAEDSESRDPVVAYLGSMGRPRHLEILIGAFARVTQTVRNARLLMIGGGDEPDDISYLKAEAVRLGISKRVEFTGFLPREAAWQRLAEADVCVSPIRPSPTFDVSSPTKILEYMALAKPSVANDQPDQKQVLEESGAGIAVPWEQEAFADGIEELLKNPGMAAAIGARGPEWVSANRSYRVIGAAVAEVYRRLVVA
jgi:glycosyltransferase involved in cell wall biosynthesis